EDGIRDYKVTGVQTCALPISPTFDGSPTMTGIAYFKRFRMEIDLHDLAPPTLPPGFHWLAWDQALLELHAEVKFQSFQDEVDSRSEERRVGEGGRMRRAESPS